jgi:uncharacterized membrane protein
MTRSNKTKRMVEFSILLAIEAIFCFVPFLGSLPALGPIVMTTMMIPVIITAIILGPFAGTLMGFFSGLFSFIVMSFVYPTLTSFVFTPIYSPGNAGSLVICFLPRILAGTAAGLLFKSMGNLSPKQAILRFGLSGFLGSFVNTIGVVGGIWLFFGQTYVTALGSDYISAVSAQYPALMGNAMVGLVLITVITSGIPEAVLGGLVAYAVCRPIIKMRKTAG